MKINTSHKSPNYWRTSTGAPLIIKPWAVVIHATAADTVQSTLGWFKNPSSKASSQYVVDKNGEIYQMIDDNVAAWHAGASEWKGTPNMNLHSIGIELVNDSHKPYPKEQVAACVELVQHLMKKWEISSFNVVRHSDISPKRKSDPYSHFPWEKFKKDILGESALIDQWEDGRESVEWAFENELIKDKTNINSDKLWTLIVLYRLIKLQK